MRHPTRCSNSFSHMSTSSKSKSGHQFVPSDFKDLGTIGTANIIRNESPSDYAPGGNRGISVDSMIGAGADGGVQQDSRFTFHSNPNLTEEEKEKLYEPRVSGSRNLFSKNRNHDAT